MTTRTKSTHRSTGRLAAGLGIVALTILSACGSSDDAADSATAPDADAELVADAPDGAEEVVEGADAPEVAGDADPAAASSTIIENSEVTVTGDPLPPLAETADDAIGLVAPIVVGQSFDGTEISIGGPSDTPTMLVFLAHWCPHCNDEIPELNSLRDSGDIPDGLRVIGISTAVAADRDNFPPSAWAEAKDWTWDIMADSVDSAALTVYGGTSFPFTVMLDANGEVLARKGGSEPAAQIKAWIDAVLAG